MTDDKQDRRARYSNRRGYTTFQGRGRRTRRGAVAGYRGVQGGATG